MMKYSIKIYLNKEIKAKVNHYFPLEFTEFILILQNLLSELSEKRERVKKFDDQFLAKTDKYLPNFYIIKLQALSFPHSVQHTYQTRFSSGPLALLEPSTNSVLLSLC